MLSLASHPSRPERVLLGSEGGGVWRSEDGGTSFTRSDTGMTNARVTVKVTSNRGVAGGLEGLEAPSELAAIAKAITGAYLSSEGNAFSTRTASQPKKIIPR